MILSFFIRSFVRRISSRIEDDFPLSVAVVSIATSSMVITVPSLFIFSLITIAIAQFHIPLPFGGFGIKKTNDGNVEFTGGQDVNFFGWGGRRNLKVIAGNGTFNIEKDDAAYVNGSEYGGQNSFGFDKEKGVDVGANLTLADKKAVGGIGREQNFLEGLFSALQNLGKPR